MTNKFYLATSYENRKFAQLVAEAIYEKYNENYKWIPSFPWWAIEPEAEKHPMMIEALGNLEADHVERSDVLIFLFPVRKGAWVELGIALSKEIPILMVLDEDIANDYLPPFIYTDRVKRIKIDKELYKDPVSIANVLIAYLRQI